MGMKMMRWVWEGREPVSNCFQIERKIVLLCEINCNSQRRPASAAFVAVVCC